MSASVSLVSFLAILNPFALCLYLGNVIEEMDSRVFVGVVVRASVISLLVFTFFPWSGEGFLVDFLGVHPEALRAFGGLIFLVVGYGYATKGYYQTELLRGSPVELPSAIALPFMIGAGTITQSILLGKRHGSWSATLILAIGLVLTFIILVIFAWLTRSMRRSREIVFQRYVNILARINGLIIGAISIDMIVSGTRQLWDLAETS